MKFGVVIFPGSNCDFDVIYSLGRILKQKVNVLWHKDRDLKKSDFIILPGGFSYGDYLRAGAIARFSPIMEKVINFADSGGYVLGICNGFQILCEAGLLPGVLLYNTNRKFICKNQYIKAVNYDTVLTKKIISAKGGKNALKIPIAHAEGRYYAEENVLNAMKKNNQIIFKYCDKDGNILIEANPNGSLENIAGVSNKKMNVFGMMPHPERASETKLGNTDGKIIFKSIIEFFYEKN